MSKHELDWGRHPDTSPVFYILNSQECRSLRQGEDNSSTALNVVWGLGFLVLGVGTVLLNLAAIKGLYRASSKTGDVFRPALYVNVSILDILNGFCTVVSGAIMLSNFTWDESDGGGKFICNLFGIIFTLVVQTKVLLMVSGLFLTTMFVVAGVKPSHQTSLRVAVVVVVLSWVVGVIQAFLPYMFGSVYSHSDHMTICTGSFSGMDYDKSGDFYAVQLILLFIPLILGMVVCCFTIPGLIIAKRSMQLYKWDDDFWGVFTTTTLFLSYLICYATYYIVHFSGMSELDGNRTIDYCKLKLINLRYFFAFMVFTMYTSGIAEPLAYLTANISVRDKLCDVFSSEPILANLEQSSSPVGNRVEPLIVTNKSISPVPVPTEEDVSQI